MLTRPLPSPIQSFITFPVDLDWCNVVSRKELGQARVRSFNYYYQQHKFSFIYDDDDMMTMTEKIYFIFPILFFHASDPTFISLTILESITMRVKMNDAL